MCDNVRGQIARNRRYRRGRGLVLLDSGQSYGFGTGITGRRKKITGEEKKNGRRSSRSEWFVSDDEEVRNWTGGKGGLALNSAQGRRRGLARFIAEFTSRSFMQRRATNLCRITEYKDGDRRPELGQRAREVRMLKAEKAFSPKRRIIKIT